MLNRFEVTIANPKRPLTFRRKHFKTLGAARGWSNRVLAKLPTVNTRYTNHWGYSAIVWDLKTGRHVEVIDAPELLALSVGEIGYW